MILALIKLLLTTSLVALGILLGLSNTTPVALSILNFSTPELPFFVWLLASLVLGILIATLFSGWRFFRFKSQQKNKLAPSS